MSTTSGSSTLAIIGGGNMGAALAGGLLASGFVSPSELVIVEVIAARLEQLTTMFPGVTISPLITPCGSAVIAVKPPDVPAASQSAVTAGAVRVLSIAAGITIKTLEVACGSGVAVIRAMPNTPGQIGKGVTAYWSSPTVPSDAEALAVSLLRPLGTVEKLQSEKQMDAVTAVSGSGPAYVFLLAEAMAAAGEAEGLERAMAERLAWQTVIGAAALMEQTGQSPQELRRAVTSPVGTSAAAIDSLTAGGGIVTLVRRAVEAAIHRSRQLGK